MFLLLLLLLLLFLGMVMCNNEFETEENKTEPQTSMQTSPNKLNYTMIYN